MFFGTVSRSGRGLTVSGVIEQLVGGHSGIDRIEQTDAQTENDGSFSSRLDWN